MLWGQLGRTPTEPSCTLGSPGHVHGPVGAITCDPGVAGQAPRHDGVMRAVLAAELQVPGGGGGARGRCRAGLRGYGSTALEERSKRWAWGPPLPPPPTHASRQMEDFTRLLPSAFLQRSICDMGPVRQGLGWGRPAQAPMWPQDLPPTYRNPCSWSARGQESCS